VIVLDDDAMHIPTIEVEGTKYFRLRAFGIDGQEIDLGWCSCFKQEIIEGNRLKSDALRPASDVGKNWVIGQGEVDCLSSHSVDEFVRDEAVPVLVQFDDECRFGSATTPFQPIVFSRK
jgi:hypothetical protein